MNEQIKELMTQAGAKYDSKGNMMYPVGFHEKFAELIVKECTSFILDSLEAANINLTSRPDDDYWLGFRHACDDHLTDIKEHFGVE